MKQKNKQAASPKISVIMPVYNTEAYLRRCLDSVVNQTLREIEIICINDASPDNSLGILYEYAANDTRVKILNLLENRRVHIARNKGMEAANGEYIGFIDSDDTIDLNFYENLYKDAVKVNADIAETTINVVCGETNKTKKNHVNWRWFVSSIYRTNFLKSHNITFPNMYGSDVVFSCRTLLAAKRRIEVAGVFYNYYQVPISSMHNITNEKSKSFVQAFDIVFNEIETALLMSTASEMWSDYLTVYFLKGFFNLVKFRITDDAKSYAAEKAVAWYHGFIRYRPVVDKKLEMYDPVLYKALAGKDIDGLTAYFLRGLQNLAKMLRNKKKGGH
jgi:glycosyltransferase involved in cell wall biosynthesis